MWFICTKAEKTLVAKSNNFVPLPFYMFIVRRFSETTVSVVVNKEVKQVRP